MELVLLVIGLLVGAFAVVLFKIRARLRGQLPDDAEIEALPEDLKKRIPVSLHPVIDPGKCIGSAACVPACPEGRVIRLHDGYAHLVQPEHCIGHGACARECPMEAITLVFGTAERGVDIPHVSEEFETNVRGLFIAGELGGMGLVRNAVRQGVEAVEHIAKRPPSNDPEVLDLLIVGAGPAGLAAALEAQRRGLRFEVVDQETTLGGTTAHYPRRKVVMLGAIRLPGGRAIKRREILKEELMTLWEEVARDAQLSIHFGERLEGIEPREGGGFTARTTSRTWAARQVLLAIGRRGSPRRLGVPGEDLPKVAYALREPEEWAGMRCLVVGGGDSALEAALALADEPGTTVDLSYRGDAFFRAKPANRDRILAAIADGRVHVHYRTQVERIEAGRVVLRPAEDGAGEGATLPNDQVFIFAGGVLPTSLLKSAGIAMERKFGTR